MVLGGDDRDDEHEHDGQAEGDGDYEYCDACFSGAYPSKFPWGMELGQMELFSRGEK